MVNPAIDNNYANPPSEPLMFVSAHFLQEVTVPKASMRINIHHILIEEKNESESESFLNMQHRICWGKN